MDPNRNGLVFIALSSVLVGTLGVTTQGIFAVAQTNALSITLWRALIAVPVIWILALFLFRRKFFAIARQDLGMVVLGGVLMAISQAGFVVAVRMATVTVATLVTVGTVPILAAVLSRIFLKEQLSRQIYLSIGLAVTGLVLLVGLQPSENLGVNIALGVVLALVSALGNAFFQICGRVLGRHYHPLQSLAVFFLVAAIALAPIALATGLTTAYPPLGWLLLLQLGVVISVVGYGLYLLGLRTVPVTVASIVGMLEPLTSATLAWLFFGERLNAMGITGALLLLSAMGIVFRSSAAGAEPISSEETILNASGAARPD